MRGQPQSRVYRLLVEHSLGLMCVHDLAGNVEIVNPAVSESLGYSIEEMTGRNLREVLAPAVLPLFDAYLERIRSDGADSGLMRLIAKDRSERVWMYRNVLHRDVDGERVLGHALDITSRVAIEHQLRRARRELIHVRDQLAARVEERTLELQRANADLRAEIEHRAQVEDELIRAKKAEALALLAGGIAHDFNNFLTVVQGNTALAQACLDPGDAVQDMLGEISRACVRATQLASKLLTFGKGGTPVRKPSRIDDLLRESAALALAGSNVKAVFDLPAGLWFAEVDPSQIVQVLNNIVLNARQAMLGGGVVHLRVENLAMAEPQGALAPGRYVRVSVVDNGCGIAEADLERIFDPYFTTKRTGNGLGLATARSIVLKHGGDISVRSVVGEGTTFFIDLPACEQAMDIPAGPCNAPASGRGRILVMDDQEPVRKVLVRALEGLGYEVEACSEGAEAVRAYEAARREGRPFAAVMLDLTIPAGVGGAETAAEIRRIDPGVKTVLSSGYTEGYDTADHRRYGFDAVLPKPWTPAQLGRVLADLLGRDAVPEAGPRAVGE